MATVRGLIILILDTLRSDHEIMCRHYSLPLQYERTLRHLVGTRPTARCGSFPTGPMRTDLLTGSLAFLGGEWALPKPNQPTLLSHCRESGYRTALVTDNYIIVIPRVGGMLIDLFDSMDFIRGAAADPWASPSLGLIQCVRDKKRTSPLRDPAFESQYIANLLNISDNRHHYKRVFESATNHLESLQSHDKFLLWVDSFACHEPWFLPGASCPYQIFSTPYFPGYSNIERFSRQDVDYYRKQYAARVSDTYAAMGPFINALETVLESGDVALAVLSDHGFLFGENGFVGKPAETPLPPALHNIVCWLSDHFKEVEIPEISAVQPHYLHHMIMNLLGIESHTASVSPVHLFGRNSPRSNFLAAADPIGLTILRKDGIEPFVGWVPWSSLDESKSLVDQALESPPASTIDALDKQLAPGLSEWLDGFIPLLLRYI